MRRRLVIWIAATLAAAVPGSAVAAPADVQGQQVLAAQLLEEVNSVRTAHHLAVLRPAPALASAAASHTREMARVGYFAHESADGTGAGGRIAHWDSPGGHAFWSVGGGLLWTAPLLAPPEMGARRPARPGQRMIPPAPTWREAGFYAARAPSAPGVYAGQSVTIVTADFGVRH